MPTAHETAYPRLKASISRRELIELYTPTPAEVELATGVSKVKARTAVALDQAITQALAEISPANAQAWFRLCFKGI